MAPHTVAGLYRFGFALSVVGFGKLRVHLVSVVDYLVKDAHTRRHEEVLTEAAIGKAGSGGRARRILIKGAHVITRDIVQLAGLFASRLAPKV